MLPLTSNNLPFDQKYASLVEEGQKAFDEGNIDGAISNFNSAIATNHRNPLAYSKLARVQLAKGKRRAAKATLRRARKNNPYGNFTMPSLPRSKRNMLRNSLIGITTASLLLAATGAKMMGYAQLSPNRSNPGNLDDKYLVAQLDGSEPIPAGIEDKLALEPEKSDTVQSIHTTLTNQTAKITQTAQATQTTQTISQLEPSLEDHISRIEAKLSFFLEEDVHLNAGDFVYIKDSDTMDDIALEYKALIEPLDKTQKTTVQTRLGAKLSETYLRCAKILEREISTNTDTVTATKRAQIALKGVDYLKRASNHQRNPSKENAYDMHYTKALVLSHIIDIPEVDHPDSINLSLASDALDSIDDAYSHLRDMRRDDDATYKVGQLDTLLSYINTSLEEQKKKGVEREGDNTYLDILLTRAEVSGYDLKGHKRDINKEKEAKQEYMQSLNAVFSCMDSNKMFDASFNLDTGMRAYMDIHDEDYCRVQFQVLYDAARSMKPFISKQEQPSRRIYNDLCREVIAKYKTLKEKHQQTRSD